MKKPRLILVQRPQDQDQLQVKTITWVMCSLRWMVPALRWKIQHSHLQKATERYLPCNSRFDLAPMFLPSTMYPYDD